MKNNTIIYLFLSFCLIACNETCDFSDVKEVVIYSKKLKKTNEDCMFKSNSKFFQKRIAKYLDTIKDKICLEYFHEKGLKNNADISEAISLTICSYDSYDYPAHSEDRLLKPVLDQSIRMIIRKNNHTSHYNGPG